MKRILLLIGLILAIPALDVSACGEIDSLKSNVGTVSMTDSSNYLITVPAGTREVIISASTAYDWVEGYAPRKVSTSERAELRVDGNACGYGIYTYFIKFKELSNIIAENTEPTTPNPTTPSEPAVTTPAPTTPEEGAQTPDGTLLQLPKLSKLVVKDHEFSFDPTKTEYTLEVDSTIKSINIEAVPEAETVTVSISNNAYNLVEGENAVTITLTDTATAASNVYKLTVVKEKEKSNNNYLSSLVVSGYPLNFDSSVTSYDLAIGKESKLDIQVETESELANYVILGNMNLDNGSTITIRVAAEDGTTRDYVLNVSRKFNIMDYWLYIILVLLVILLIVILVIMKQKKNKKGKPAAPKAVEPQAATAGVVQEMPASQPSIPETPQNTQINTVPPVQSNGTLQIIEPTNIETPPVQNNMAPTDTGSATEESATEVFQL